MEMRWTIILFAALLILLPGSITLAQHAEDSVSRIKIPDVRTKDSAFSRYPQIVLKDVFSHTDDVWKKRVWRKIDIYESENTVLRDDPEMPAQNVFANILLNGIIEGAYTAYALDNDSNTVQMGNTDKWIDFDKSPPSKEYVSQPLTLKEITDITKCAPALLSPYSRAYLNFYSLHLNDSMKFYLDKPEKEISKSTPAHYDTSFVPSCTYPQQITSYSIMEDWIFEKDKGEMVVRIIAIAPMKNVNGIEQPLFWIFYPDIRKYISKYEVYKGKQKLDQNWTEYFESRSFSSRITKVESPEKLHKK